jgi:hypothetical protein
MLRALAVALDDMTSRHREPPPGAGAFTTEIYRCLARIDSWDAQVVTDDAENWVIFVEPKERRCFPDEEWHFTDVYGEYVISKADFSIVAADLGGG